MPKLSKSKALVESRKTLKKMKDINQGNKKVFSPNKQFPHISTGSIMINHLIGGSMVKELGVPVCPGAPRGRLMEVYGPESSGKTTLAISIAAQAQKLGGTAAVLDYENALHDGYAQKLGLLYDDDLLDIWVPETMEEGFRMLEVYIKNNVDIVIVDSVSAMVPQKALEGDIAADEMPGIRARKMSQFLSKMVGFLRHSKTCVIFVNQVRTVIKISKYATGPNEVTSGGNSIKFYSTIRMKLRKVKEEKLKITDPLTGGQKEKPIGVYTKVTCIKNKLDSKQGDSGEIFIRFGKGIDNIRTILDIAIIRKVIKKSGSWFAFDVDDDQLSFKVHGKEKVQVLFHENPNVYDAVKTAVLDKINTESDIDEMGANEIDEGEVIVEEFYDEEESVEDDYDNDDDITEVTL